MYILNNIATMNYTSINKKDIQIFSHLWLEFYVRFLYFCVFWRLNLLLFIITVGTKYF